MAEEQKQPPAQENQPAAEPQQPQQAMESQVTSKTRATMPAKNPKRVEAGKAVAEKTRLAREAQKQKADRYDQLMAKESAPAPEPAPETEPKPAAADSNVLTTGQWLTIAGLVLTVVINFNKIKEAFFGKKQAPPPPENAPQVTHESPPQPVLSLPRPRKGIRNMD